MATMKDTYRAVFGEEMKKEAYNLMPHSFKFNKRIGKQVCSTCGLVSLRNQFTDWSVRMGCLSSDHPQYMQARSSMTALSM